MQPQAALTFAKTKIQPPRPRPRSDLISRPALDAGLGKALVEQRLTLVLAPAGWGKTSALARQLAQLPAGTALAWVAADADDDVPRFLAGLTAALEPHDLPWQVAPSALVTLLQAERGLRLVADEIVNALSESDVARGLLVIDDVHRWTDPALFELLKVVIEHLPGEWGLVLSSRTEPPLPLARWRARGELAEFRQGTLRFDTSEIRALLEARGLSADRAEELHRRTEGWAAGLRLMLSVDHRAGALTHRSQREVFDYLADEVLAGMTPDLRLFLLRCSVLPELSVERCAQVSAMPNAAALFEQVERNGLFVTPLDDAGRTLRLHDLFRDFLEDRLQREYAADVPALLQRAAEHEPNLLRAVTWLTRAGAMDLAASRLAGQGPALLPVGGWSDLMRMFALFPDAQVQSNPDLAFLRGLCAWQFFEFEPMVVVMTAAERGLQEAGRDDMATLTSILMCGALLNVGRADESRARLERAARAQPKGDPGALLGYIQAYQAEKDRRAADVVPAIETMVQQLEAVPESPVWDDIIFMAVLAPYAGAAAAFERYLHVAGTRRARRAGAQRVAENHLRASLALGRGELQQAADFLASADEDIEWLGRPLPLQYQSFSMHEFVEALSGRADEARRWAEGSIENLHRSPRSYQRAHMDSGWSQAMRVNWVLGDADAVRRCRTELYRAADPWEWGTAPANRALADGLVALLDDKPQDAERSLLEAARDNPWADFNAGRVALVLAAHALRIQGRLDDAATTLRRVLADPHLPQTTGYILMAGPAVIRDLADAAWGKRLNAAEQAELRRWTALLGGQVQPDPEDEAQALPANLTLREAEVLELIAKGLANKVIARDLALSPFTVERHVANILVKTGLTSRTELAAWWVRHRRQAPTRH
jgi:LuxR family maltose regulon positive regulatory protein